MDTKQFSGEIDFCDYIASSQEQKRVESSFQLHSFNLNFLQTKPDYLKSIPTESGIYFIAGKRKELLKVYVGKAKNIRSRIKNYHQTFQVHCPNDSKMLFFQNWLLNNDADWKLVLYTLETNDENSSTIEADWINQLNPLVNATIRITDNEIAERIHDEYRAHFESYFLMRTVGDKHCYVS